MVRLYTDRRMLDHITPAGHPERPERLASILRQLDRTGLSGACRAGQAREASDEELLRVHTADYLREVADFEARHEGRIEPDTWIGHGTNLAARLAAGSAVQAVRDVVQGPAKTAFCAVRPPGHHARPAHAMGFCIFGNIAAAAAEALKGQGMNRVLIVDWDVHHGNGTQEIFDADPRVGFLSIHRYPFYPGTGAADETGTGPGRGTKRNVPIRHGTARPDYIAAFRKALEELADRIRPELVLISAGFDAHAEDPIGDLGLEIEDFVTLTHLVQDVANTHANGRIVSALEGGYNLPILAGCVAAHLEALGVEPPLGPS
jgi:acetoin utilization deacetylase AcuC-like enzyme